MQNSKFHQGYKQAKTRSTRTKLCEIQLQPLTSVMRSIQPLKLEIVWQAPPDTINRVELLN